MKQAKLLVQKIKVLFAGSIFIFICLFSDVAAGETSNYWPTQGWRFSTPEDQGLSSDILADMLDTILSSPNSIDSVTVIKNGYIVLDAYIYPFQKDWAHIIHSCTKSITSTLIGIAIDKGYITDINQRLLDFFPKISPDNMTEFKKDISLENILTMATGFDCQDSYKYKWTGLIKMHKSSNWTQYMLDLPMREKPGLQFEYCNGATYLLSAILQKTTGMRSLDFAFNNLFNPLGIKDVKWERNPQGIDVGYGRMWLKPHDMAKFGWLFLKNGKWDGKTIVSEQWIAKATRGHVDSILFDRYGYQWWIDKQGYYAAVGYGGQRIFVVPKHDMVVVFTSYNASTKPDRLMKNYIVKSILSDGPVSSKKHSTKRLATLLENAKMPPEAIPVKELPSLSNRISGVTYKIEDNQMGLTYVTLQFDREKTVAVMAYGLNNKQSTVEIGLDGVFRFTEVDGEKLAFKGKWLNTDSFLFTSINVGHTRGLKGLVKFIDKKALITVTTPGSMFNLKGSSE